MKTLNAIFTTFIVTAILLVAGLSFASMLPIPGQIGIKIVKSGSMEPGIQTGGIVVIQPANAYGIGDVITFGEDTKMAIPTTHRIIDMRTEDGVTWFTTKGDANEERDPEETSVQNVVGRVLFTVPYAGYVLDFAKQPLGFTLLVLVPAGLLILNELLSIYSELRGLKRRPRTQAPVARTNASPAHPTTRVLYTRVSRMDDIYVPRTFRNLTISNAALADAPRQVPTIGVALMLAAVPIGIGMFALFNTHATRAYFTDMEASVGNLLSAATLDFSVDAEAPRAISLQVGLGEEEGSAFAPFVADIDSTIAFEYRIVTQMMGGDADFCNALTLKGSAPVFDYDGALLSLSTGTTTDQSPWDLELYLPADTVVADGTNCLVDLVYQGTQEEGGVDSEYHDEERLPLLITYVAAPAPFRLALPEEAPVPEETPSEGDPSSYIEEPTPDVPLEEVPEPIEVPDPAPEGGVETP